MQKPLKIGIVGAGNISGAHLDASKQTGITKPVAICDIIEERAKKRQEQYGIGEVYTDYKEMLAKADIEAVWVCVPNYIHHEVTIAALKAGKHVLCEKPMSFNPAWAEEMVAAQKEAGKVLQIGMVSRYLPYAQYLKDAVVAGELGNVYFARAQYVRRSGIPGWGSWFTRKDMAGGGPLIDIGVHRLDLTWYLMGSPKPVSVYGSAYSELGPKKMGLGAWGTPEWDGRYDVEDFAAALIKMENGATISLEAAWAGYTAPSQVLDLLGSEKGARVLENGKVEILSQKDRHDIDAVVSMPAKSGDAFQGGFARQMDAFVKTVRGEAPCIAPAEHGLAVTRMLAAIYESAKTGSEVKL